MVQLGTNRGQSMVNQGLKWPRLSSNGQVGIDIVTFGSKISNLGSKVAVSVMSKMDPKMGKLG